MTKVFASLQYLRRACIVIAGLFLFSTGSIVIYRSNLGLGAWDVLHQGLSLHTPLSYGQATMVVGAGIIVLGLCIKIWPGVGTLLNMLLVGFFRDWLLATHWFLDLSTASLWLRLLANGAGVFIVGMGTALYILPRLGAGPRDGLMLRLHQLTRIRIAFVRVGLDLLALIVGVFLGGPIGIGTLIFALGLGPSVETNLWLTRRYLLWLVPAPKQPATPALPAEAALPAPVD